MDWIPTLSEWHGPMFLRIVDALAADIASGRLVRGQRLPTHRALATALDIDLTTVTRAYGEARRRGLLDARVGQGTFVSETTARGVRPAVPVNIDLSMNLPPQPVEANLDLRIAQGLATIRSEAGFSAPILRYTAPGGTADEREVGAAWLRPRLPDASADRIVDLSGIAGDHLQRAAGADLARRRGADGGADISRHQGRGGAARRPPGRRSDGRRRRAARRARRGLPQVQAESGLSRCQPSRTRPRRRWAGAAQGDRRHRPEARLRADRGRRLRPARAADGADRDPDSRAAPI